VEKQLSLKDGRKVLIRDMAPGDAESSFEFFARLPEEDRKYLRRDVTRRKVVQERIARMDPDRDIRLVAVSGGEIVADGTLELAGHGWGDNIAEMRLIVARSHQRLGLGTLLARELYSIAAERRVDRIITRMMRPQKGARNIMHKLGFQEEFLIPEHVRDTSGQWQDMIIMRCNLEELWSRMESLIHDSDWQRHR
jgi:GNAT superfamily N-acetyltransferase